jgi:hypothetical protein
MFSLSRFSRVLAVTLGIGFSHQSSAQSAHPWSADATIGGGIGRGGEFFNNDRPAAHLAVTDRLLQRGKVAVYAEAGYDWLDLEVGGDAICVFNSRGGCRPRYPEIAGPSISIGALVAPWSRVETRVGLGGAAYSVNDTRVGAVVCHLDAAAYPATHLGLIFGAGFVVVPRYRHDRLTMIPVLFGLRLR